MPTSAVAQRLGGDVGSDISLLRVAAALILCLVLAVAIALLVRSGKLGPVTWARLGLRGAPRRRVAVIETRRMSAHADVCLIEADGEAFVVIVSAHAHTILRRGALDPAGADECR